MDGEDILGYGEDALGDEALGDGEDVLGDEGVL